MKSLLVVSVAFALLATSGFTGAASDIPQRTLTPVTVKNGTAINCTPPSSDEACASLHLQIRHDFRKREIGMLFGARTSYPEYLTSYTQVNERYQAFLRDVDYYGPERVALVVR